MVDIGTCLWIAKLLYIASKKQLSSKNQKEANINPVKVKEIPTKGSVEIDSFGPVFIFSVIGLSVMAFTGSLIFKTDNISIPKEIEKIQISNLHQSFNFDKVKVFRGSDTNTNQIYNHNENLKPIEHETLVIVKKIVNTCIEKKCYKLSVGNTLKRLK